MRRVSYLFFAIGLAGFTLAGCATGLEGPDIEGSGGGDSTGTTGSSSGDPSTSATSSDTSSSVSSSSGGPMCEADEHLCGGICAPNTPQTGCYQSDACTPCSTVTNGTTKCSSDGLCDFDCLDPYQKSGNTCACPTQCCSASDCSSGQSCENGQCITPCDPFECLALCLLQMKAGMCSGNQCVCI